ncbi:pseudouridine synthase [Streptococcus catagoni]|uniref:pseudouridine synthase n=1 Tax=Streptococcus catagoni TaxID=2654874 RepID=UPI001408973A|nr:pseudouridine synthase [Streptococcus catagoni]
MRLDKLLENTKIGSKNQVKKLIKARQVTIDGRIATSGRQNVDSGIQEILVEGQQIRAFPEAYYLLNKPAGTVTARTDSKHQTVVDLLREDDKKEGIYPLGRLDRDTEGLVLMTTNGPLGFRMLHPKYHVKKKYYLAVNGFLGQDAVEFFMNGVVFPDGNVCKPAQLEIIEEGEDVSLAYLTISEGKFHQVKKMFLTYGLKLIYLKRVAFAEFELSQLKVGDYRPLTKLEKDKIKAYLD